MKRTARSPSPNSPRHMMAQAPYLSALFCAVALLPMAAFAQSVSTGTASNVIVDTTVLDMYGPAPGYQAPVDQRTFPPRPVYSSPAYTPGYRAITQGGMLLPPPATAPKSMLTIAPQSLETGKAYNAGPAPKAQPQQKAQAQTPVPPSPPETVPSAIPSPVQGSNKAMAAAPATPATPSPAPTAPMTPAAPASGSTNSAQVAAKTPEPTAAQPQAPETQTAPAKPEPAKTGESGAAPALPADGLRLVYTADNDQMPQSGTAQLDALVKKMTADESLRVQVLAYASGTADTESKARRLSLSRALDVRGYLIKAGIRSSRIEVRALGMKTEGQPEDRVDVVPIAAQ